MQITTFSLNENQIKVDMVSQNNIYAYSNALIECLKQEGRFTRTSYTVGQALFIIFAEMGFPEARVVQYDTISYYTGKISYNTYLKAIRQLEYLGFVEVVEPSVQRSRQAKITLHVPDWFVGTHPTTPELPDDMDKLIEQETSQSKPTKGGKKAKRDKTSQKTAKKGGASQAMKQSADKIDYQGLVAYWNECTGDKARVTDKKRTQIKARLKTFSYEEIKQAIKVRSDDEWINSEGVKYKTSWESLFRNDEKLEYWLKKLVKPSADQFNFRNVLNS